MCTAVGPRHAVEGVVERPKPVLGGPLGPRLHVRLVDLHDVGAGGKEVADLPVHRGRVVHRGLFLARIVVVLGLLPTS